MLEKLMVIMSLFIYVLVVLGSVEGVLFMLDYYLNSDDENILKCIQVQYVKMCKDVGWEGGVISMFDFYKVMWGLFVFIMNIYVYGELQCEDGSEWLGCCEVFKGFEVWLLQEVGFIVDDGLFLFIDFNEIEVYI